MSYEIHIERTPALTLDEWNAAVRGTGVRLDGVGASATHPKTETFLILGGGIGAYLNTSGRIGRQ